MRWEPEEKLHVTVRFLGTTSQEQKKYLSDALLAFSTSITPFDLVFHFVGVFPDMRHPRVLWAGALLTEGISNVWKSVESLARSSGYPADTKAIHPHSTLARIRAKDDVASLTGVINSITFDPVLTRASEIVLMKSVLLQGGSQYTRLATFPFKRHRSDP